MAILNDLLIGLVELESREELLECLADGHALSAGSWRYDAG